MIQFFKHFHELIFYSFFKGTICTHVGLFDPIKKAHSVRKLELSIINVTCNLVQPDTRLSL